MGYVVERRRREVINDGIETIAKIVPGTEKNKGAILQRTAQYIQELQDQISKFETERATYDVAINELSKRVDHSKESMKQAWQESNKWQQRCREGGLTFDDYDAPVPDFEGLGNTDLDGAIGS
jgi:transcriptional regulator CBF1